MTCGALGRPCGWRPSARSCSVHGATWWIVQCPFARPAGIATFPAPGYQGPPRADEPQNGHCGIRQHVMRPAVLVRSSGSTISFESCQSQTRLGRRSLRVAVLSASAVSRCGRSRYWALLSRSPPARHPTARARATLSLALVVRSPGWPRQAPPDRPCEHGRQGASRSIRRDRAACRDDLPQSASDRRGRYCRWPGVQRLPVLRQVTAARLMAARLRLPGRRASR